MSAQSGPWCISSQFSLLILFQPPWLPSCLRTFATVVPSSGTLPPGSSCLLGSFSSVKSQFKCHPRRHFFINHPVSPESHSVTLFCLRAFRYFKEMIMQPYIFHGNEFSVALLLLFFKSKVQIVPELWKSGLATSNRHI